MKRNHKNFYEGLTLIEVSIALALFEIIASILFPFLSDLQKMRDKTDRNSFLRWKAIELVEREKAGIPCSEKEVYIEGRNYIIEKTEIKRNNSVEVLFVFKEEDGNEVFQLSALRP